MERKSTLSFKIKKELVLWLAHALAHTRVDFGDFRAENVANLPQFTGFFGRKSPTLRPNVRFNAPVVERVFFLDGKKTYLAFPSKKKLRSGTIA